MIMFNPFQKSEQLIKLFCVCLKNLSSEKPSLKKFIEKIDGTDFLNRRDFKTLAPPVALKNSLINIGDDAKSSDELLDLTLKISFNLNWQKIYDGIDRNLPYGNGMFASRLLGLDGYFFHDNLSIGQMLLLPGVTYPFHTHDVDEIYYCLSGTLDIYHGLGGKLNQLKCGNISITPEGQLHMLKVKGSKPVLLIYCWLGDLKAPIWLWNKSLNHRWERTLWKRSPGQSWTAGLSEPVSKAMLLDAYKKIVN